MEQIKVERKSITPSLAKEMLSRNEGNRRLSQKWVSYYASQMRSGDWMDTTDTIKIAPDGRVLDGQHRLSGVIEYGKPVFMWLASNVDPDAFTVLDTGKRRSAADAVYIAGHKNATSVSAIAKAILASPDGRYGRNMKSGGAEKSSPTHTHIIEFITENPEIHEVAAYALSVGLRFKFIQSIALVGSLYWHFAQKNMKKTDEFFEGVCEGIDLGKTHPIRLLRERLMRDAGERSKLNLTDKAALFVYAWNAFRQGREMTQLLLPRGSDFPKIV